jgi:phosphoglycerate dehydrogenase-like enzyme
VCAYAQASTRARSRRFPFSSSLFDAVRFSSLQLVQWDCESPFRPRLEGDARTAGFPLRGAGRLLRPRVCVFPSVAELEAAVERGGGTVSGAETADALVLVEGNRNVDVLLNDGMRWVQSSSAGNENLIRAGLVDGKRVWTSAAGVYARPIAEHVLGLLLAAARNVHAYARARSWQQLDARMLGESTVGVIGAGGIGSAVIAHLDGLGARTIAITRSGRGVARASDSGGPELLPRLLAISDFVVLSAPLTRETRRLIGVHALEQMQSHAWVVNVARGELVDTEALVAALRAGRIGGAALDTVDPKPVPDGHPLWGLPNTILTPHTAATPREWRRLFADRVAENVGRFARGEPLLGTIDPELGY